MSTQGNTIGRFLKVIRDHMIMVAIVILVVATAIIQPKFFSIQNMTNILSQIGPLSFAALGMTFAIVCGFIDLSMAGVMSLTAVVTARLIDPLGQIPALLLGLAFGALLGYLNGTLVVSAGAMSLFDAIFITFGMSAVYGALALIVSNGETLQMRWITQDKSIFDSLGSGTVGPFPIPLIVFIVALAVLHIFLTKTFRGRSITLSGGNKTAARLAGIPVKKTVKLVFTLSGLLSALGVIVLFSRNTTVSPKLGLTYDTNSILAVVIGGTTLAGGNGGVIRTFFGILLVTLLENCMNLLGVSTHLHSVMSGIIFIAAIWLDSQRERKGAIA